MPSPLSIAKFLDGLAWPRTVDDKESYSRIMDDHDGTCIGRLIVMFGPDGDAYVGTEAARLMRFRTSGGGGQSPRTHAALLVLAEAMRLDNEARPQSQRAESQEARDRAAKVLDERQNSPLGGLVVNYQITGFAGNAADFALLLEDGRVLRVPKCEGAYVAANQLKADMPKVGP